MTLVELLARVEGRGKWEKQYGDKEVLAVCKVLRLLMEVPIKAEPAVILGQAIAEVLREVEG